MPEGLQNTAITHDTPKTLIFASVTNAAHSNEVYRKTRHALIDYNLECLQSHLGRSHRRNRFQFSCQDDTCCRRAAPSKTTPSYPSCYAPIPSFFHTRRRVTCCALENLEADGTGSAVARLNLTSCRQTPPQQPQKKPPLHTWPFRRSLSLPCFPNVSLFSTSREHQTLTPPRRALFPLDGGASQPRPPI